MEICRVDRHILEVALALNTSDFEDAVQIACASTQNLDAIVTRDTGLTTALIPVLSVSQMSAQLETSR